MKLAGTALAVAVGALLSAWTAQPASAEAAGCCAGSQETAAACPMKTDGSTTKPTTAPAEVWGCTMCPDVKADKPGKCPKCGMDLTKKEADAPKQSDGHKHDHKH